MEFPVCFTTAKYENDMFVISLSLCETSNAFIDAFCYSRIHFHESGPFKLIDYVEIFTRFLGVDQFYVVCFCFYWVYMNTV